LNLEDGSLVQNHVSQTFGFVDMYRQFGAWAPNKHDLEKRLSRLSDRAGEVVAEVERV